MAKNIIEYWKVQNAGWSNGVSWFDYGSSYRFSSYSDAFSNIEKIIENSDSMWRIVHVTIEKYDNKLVRTEEYQNI